MRTVGGHTTHRAVMSGLLVVDKPLACSSMDVVRRVRHIARGVKTGHAGTLDPLATGVVVCCLGRATRCVSHLMGLTKVYEAQIDLSAFTTTDDREGQRDPVEVLQPPDRVALQKALGRFLGDIEQRPPAYSAVYVNGQRAYKRARRGESFELPLRTVHIHAIELTAYTWPIAGVRITCGKGTYIRSLARDLGSAMGTGGHLATLRRLAVGDYDLSMAVDVWGLDWPLNQSDLIAPPMPVAIQGSH